MLQRPPGLQLPVADATMAQVVAAPVRLRIVRALLDGERSFEALQWRTLLAGPELLAQLNRLCQQGVLGWRHDRAQVLYHLCAGTMQALTQALRLHGQACPLTPTEPHHENRP